MGLTHYDTPGKEHHHPTLAELGELVRFRAWLNLERQSIDEAIRCVDDAIDKAELEAGRGE